MNYGYILSPKNVLFHLEIFGRNSGFFNFSRGTSDVEDALVDANIVTNVF